MADPEDESAASTRLARAVAWIKHHPLVSVAVTTVAVISFVFEATDQFTRVADVISDRRNPHAAEYSALKSLDLDTRLEFFEANFGTAKSEFDLCREVPRCPEPVPQSLRLYIHETEDLAIRAVFDGPSLEMYAVTLMSPTLSPTMEWLGYDLGELGTVTFDDAIDEAGSIEPTDTEIFIGPQSTAYAEVVSVGAPGKYRGLLLAIAPDGYFGSPLTFDSDSAGQLNETQVSGRPPDPAVLTSFRSASTPNTYGEFRDDGGYVSTLVREAGDVIPLLFVGTEL